MCPQSAATGTRRPRPAGGEHPGYTPDARSPAEAVRGVLRPGSCGDGAPARAADAPMGRTPEPPAEARAGAARRARSQAQLPARRRHRRRDGVASRIGARALDEPRVVVLCDTSGSMDVHVRFLLAFVLALKGVAKKTEVFAFNTSLTRLTPWLVAGPDHSRPSSGSRPICRTGRAARESARASRSSSADTCTRSSSSRSVVVILSDGLDRGDTSLVAAAMRAIRSKARRIVWLNPLAGDPRYEPTARAMQAALPFIDRLAPAHNLESLERLVPRAGGR